jgi:hypothetical protein
MAMSLAMAEMVTRLAGLGVGRVRLLRPGARTPARRRAVRKVCSGCERQRALFRRHGVVTWDRYHTLCLRCLRSKAWR